MELSQLIDHPVTETFTDRGEKVEITYNANAFTPDFLRNVAAAMREMAKPAPAKTGTRTTKKGKTEETGSDVDQVAARLELTADMLELRRKVYVKFLARDNKQPILVDWDITDNQKPTKPTYEVLMRLNPRTVIGIWEWCLESINPQGREATKTEPTPPNAEAGSFTRGGPSETDLPM